MKNSNKRTLKSKTESSLNQEIVKKTKLSVDPSNDYLKFDTGKTTFESFIGNDIGLDKFLAEYWEKKPLFIQRSENEKWIEYVKTLFSLDQLKEIIKTNNLKYGQDINLCKLVNDKKKNFNKNGPVKLDHVTKCFEKDSATIQFHQPQRFSDQLWRLIEKFECYFNNLVGSNIYITPDDSQGLPPHHDDIEAFVIQLEGIKQWLIYKPTHELPNEYTLADKESVKEPILDITLKPGDILYFPRGFIHQAKTPKLEKNSYSTHITISTFQNNNNMEFILSVIHKLKQSFDKNISLRKGLSFDFFRKSIYNEILKEELNKIEFEPNSCYPTELLKDFMRSRLPPFDSNLSTAYSINELANIQKLAEGLKIKLSHPEHVNISIDTDLNDETDEENEDDDEYQDENDKSQKNSYKLFVFHSMTNRRESHMIIQENEKTKNCLKLPIECHRALKLMVDNTENKWFELEELKEKIDDCNDKEEKLKQLLISLKIENLIETKC